MRQFVFRIGLFWGLFAGIALAADVLVTTGLQEKLDGPFGTWRDIYQGRVDSDLVVVGSSRAMAHVSPEILSERLELSVYNLGFNGYHFPMQEVRFDEFMRYNRKPKIVVLTLDTTNLHDRKTAFQYEQFLPYFRHKTLVEAVSRYEGYRMLDRWLPMYRYRGRGSLVLQGVYLAIGLATSESDRYRGYRGREVEWDGSFDEFAKHNRNGYQIDCDPKVEQRLAQFVAQRKLEGTTTIMVFTPEYKTGQAFCLNRNRVVESLRSIATSNDTPFLDYSDHPICKDRRLFYNSQHLNRSGAERFSKILAERISTIVLSERDAT